MRHMSIALVSAAFLVAGAGAALAGVNVPELNMELAVGSSQWEWRPQGEFVGEKANAIPGVPDNDGLNYAYVGGGTWGGISLDWNITANPDPFVFALIGVTNNTNATQTISLITTLPIAPAITPSSLIGGSTQGGLTADADGGTLATAGPGTWLYRAMIDGVPVGGIADLFGHLTSASAGPFGSGSVGVAQFGAPIPSAPGPAAFSTIGIMHTFTLTPGDRATFTSSFVVAVPSAGALPLLGIAGMLGARRRRA